MLVMVVGLLWALRAPGGFALPRLRMVAGLPGALRASAAPYGVDEPSGSGPCGGPGTWTPGHHVDVSNATSIHRHNQECTADGRGRARGCGPEPQSQRRRADCARVRAASRIQGRPPRLRRASAGARARLGVWERLPSHGSTSVPLGRFVELGQPDAGVVPTP